MKWEKLIEQKHLYIGGEIKEVGSPFKHINLIVDINVRPAIDKVPIFIITTEDWLAGGEIKEAKLIKSKDCVKIITGYNSEWHLYKKEQQYDQV